MYTYRYFTIVPKEAVDAHFWIIWYIRVLILINILLVLIAGLLIFGLLMTLLAKCCQMIASRTGRTGILYEILFKITNALGIISPGVVNYVMSNMQKTKFRHEVYTHLKECPICLLEFIEGVDIIELPCDSRHYFHANCIGKWISDHNRITCPICNKSLEQELRKSETKKEEKAEPKPAEQSQQKKEASDVPLNSGNVEVVVKS